MSQTATRANAQPVLIAMSVLAGLQLLFAGAGLVDVIGAKAVFLGIAFVGAAQGGIQFWVKNQVTAVANVVAQVDPAGQVVAGLALADVGKGALVNVTPVLSG